jgi:ribonuclease HII
MDKEQYKIMNQYEEEALKKGYKRIVGIDEVGRGPMAGPVVVAGFILKEPIYGLADSKKLTKKRINELAKEIKEKALAYKIIEYSPLEIDEIGMKKCVMKAMERVPLEIDIKPDYALIDYEKPNLEIDSLSLTKGDTLSNSIAAASIIAKQYRDQIMEELGKEYPNYGFENHVGYITKKHKEAVIEYGPIKGVHRFSYKPIQALEDLD